MVCVCVCRVGKLHLVDLAGSEKQAKTGSVVRLPHTHTHTRAHIDT